MSHTLTLLARQPVTHDTTLFIFDKPEGFTFTPGEAVLMRLDRDGWRDEERPFTMTSLPEEVTLQFTIKSYPDHRGVTDQIGQLKEGERVMIGDPWGAIEDKGDGVFIAGGAGVTPFIAILRDKLRRAGTLEGNTLVFSNRTERDIILREEFEAMPGLACHWTVTDDDDSALDQGRIGRDLLERVVRPGRDALYICGPDPMIDAVRDALCGMGAEPESIVTEDGH